MRKLILALMALACLSSVAEAQQQQKFIADQGKAGAAPWPITWGAGLAVSADLRVAGTAVATGNPVPVSVGNFPSTQPVSNAGSFAVQNTASTPAGANSIGTVGLNSGTNAIGTVGVTALPSLAAGTNVIGAVTQSGGPWTVSGTVTANLGTLNGAATDSAVNAVRTTLGSPFQTGAQIGNTAFGISGTLPAFAATPTFNLGTLNGAATAAKQPALGTAGTPSVDVLTVQGNPSGAPLPIVTTNGATAANQARAVTYSDTFNASIAASAATPPASHATPTPNIYSKFNAYFFATNAATYNIEASVDGGASFFTIATGTVAANTPQFQTVPLTYGLYRAYLINQSTTGPMTARVATSFTAN